MNIELNTIRDHLSASPRDLLLFEMIVHTKVPVKELLRLRVNDVKDLALGDELPIYNGREHAGAVNPVVTPQLNHALTRFLRDKEGKGIEFLFKSRKGDRPLSGASVSRIIRGWKEETGLTHYRGLPSLRQAQQECADKGRASETDRPQTSPGILPKIKTRTVQEIVYNELENAIVSGRIPPGQKLVTEEIARMMDVSRIPVREAMGRLEARGFISTRPKWGSLVTKFSRSNLQEISEMRILLEPRAGQKAVERVDKDFLTRLEKAQTEYAIARKGTETEELLRTNRQFHFLIYEQAGAPILLDIIKQLWDKVSPYYHLMFRQSLDRSPTEGVNYHDQIVASLKNGDKKGVKKWLKSDLTGSTGYIIRLFDANAHNEISF